MAGGQHYSGHQKGIIKRYYENKDTIMHQKLSGLVGDLYICESAKKADKMWKSAETALTNMGVRKSLVEHLMEDRHVEALAEGVGELV